MKKLFTLFVAVLLTASVFAQSPEKLSYQAVIRNSSDALVINTQVGMQISILQGTADGSPVYVETQTPTTNANGLVSIEIGVGTVVSGDFTAIDWTNGPYYIKTETDPAGGTSYSITGTSQLLSVPYALHAKTAETVSGTITETDPVFEAWGKNYNDLTDKPVSIQHSDTSEISKSLIIMSPSGKLYKVKVDDSGSIFAEEIIRVRDYEGNIYQTVTIGSQVWMAENLKATKYSDGTDIPLITDNSAWADLADNNYADACCFYNNNTESEYGALYTFAAAMNACPTGWHLPNTLEWMELTSYLANNGYNFDGSIGDYGDLIAKAVSTDYGWEESSEHGAVGNTDFPDKRNASGFSALPAGSRAPHDGAFGFAGKSCAFWGSEYNNSDGNIRVLNYSLNYFGPTHTNKSHGLSVRCVRD